LIATLSPESVTQKLEFATKTLSEALGLGLVQCDNDDLITLGSGIKDVELRQDDPNHALRLLPSVIIRLAFADQQNTTNDDLGMAIAWILTKSPLERPLVWDDADRDLIRIAGNQTGALGIQGNDARFGNLCHWITFLGLARDDGTNDTRLVADPTVAIRTALRTVLPTSERTALSDALAKLAMVLPVIDGGKYNLQFLSKYPIAATPLDGRVSPALSMALLRLQDEGTIRLTHEADARAPKRLSVGGHLSIYSSIQYLA